VRQELQSNRRDPAADTLIWTDGQVAAFEWLVERYREEFLNRQFSGAGLGPGAVPTPGRGPPDHRLRRLDGLDRLGPPPRQALLLYQQLAARAPGGQPPDRGGRHLEHPVDHRPAWRHRGHTRPLWPVLVPAGLARRGGAAAALPAAPGGGPDAGPAL